MSTVADHAKTVPANEQTRILEVKFNILISKKLNV